MADLKPCPFCGGEPVMLSCDWSGGYYAEIGTKMCYGRELTHRLIMCRKCKAKTHPYITPKHLYNTWNRRVNND